MLQRLKESVRRYGIVQPLVVRLIGPDSYEVLSGNQRLQVLKESGWTAVPCVVVDLGDGHARLLAQALNRIRGEDDLGLRAQLLQEVLVSLPAEEVLAILPETPGSLQALATLGKHSMAEYLENWQQAQQARLKHLTFQLTPAQLEIVDEALAIVLPLATGARENPNARGTTLYLLCMSYLESHRRTE